MSKFLCIASTSISALVFVVFLLDVVAGVPFQKANMLADIVFIICSAGIAALSVLSLRQVR